MRHNLADQDAFAEVVKRTNTTELRCWAYLIFSRCYLTDLPQRLGVQTQNTVLVLPDSAWNFLHCIYLCNCEITHRVKPYTSCQHTNYHNTINHSGYLSWLNCFNHMIYMLCYGIINMHWYYISQSTKWLIDYNTKSLFMTATFQAEVIVT